MRFLWEKVDCLIVLCPTCQTENPDDVRDCRACSHQLTPDLDKTQLLGRGADDFLDSPTVDISDLSGKDRELSLQYGRDVCRFPPLDLPPNSKFGPRYEIVSLLGQGGMGKVYRARDLEVDRTVALKLVRPELAMNPQAMARFRQELVLASKISHRNVLRIHDLGDVDGIKFISMALVEGMDLHDQIARDGALPFSRALHIALQLTCALEAAHAEGVIHRDLKPRNILLDSNDHVYVTDFGLAKSVETESAGMTRSGDFIGTPLYMSPEQIESKTVDSRSDLYSLGLIFHEMVTGDLPFAGKSSVQVMHSRMTTAPKDPKALAPTLPTYFACVIAKCLTRDPAERYQSAAEIRRDLEASIAPHRSVKQRLPKPNRTWGLVAAAMAVAAGVTVAVPTLREKLLPSRGLGVPAGPTYYMAVMPFKPLGDTAELKYQAEGIVEALNSKLFPLKQVNLAAPTLVERAGTVEKVAKELGANLIVQGTVQHGGDRLAINVSVLDAKKNAEVWKQQFLCAPDSLLTTEEEIYDTIVDKLGLKLSTLEIARGTARATEDSGAYDLYMRGRSLIRGKTTAENYKAAIVLFNQAIERDSRFARAYAGIAESYYGLYRNDRDLQWTDKGLNAAEQAISLDKTLPDVHLVVGTGYVLKAKFTEAISEFNRAVELAPSSDEAYRRLGNAYARTKNKEMALRNLNRAIKINPYSYANFNTLGLAERDFGDAEAAVAAFKKVIQLQPDASSGYTNVAHTYCNQGKFPECIQYFEKALTLEKSPLTYQNLGVTALYMGNGAKAVPLLEEAARLAPKNHLNFGNLGDAYRETGETVKADTAYQKAIDLALAACRLNSKDAPTFANLALYYAKKGDLENAETFINRARAIDPANAEVMYTEAVVLHLAKKDTQALTALKNSLDKGYPARVAASDDALRTLRTNPEFQKVLAEHKKAG